jgi:hypothetical protein
MRATGTDRGAVRVSYITKLAIAMAIFGVAGYDGVTLLVTHVSMQTDAGNAANAASQDWQTTHNVTLAFQAAQENVAGHHEAVLQCAGCFSIAADNTVHLVLRRTAKTVVMSRVGFLKKYAIVTEAGEANYNPT